MITFGLVILSKDQIHSNISEQTVLIYVRIKGQLADIICIIDVVIVRQSG